MTQRQVMYVDGERYEFDQESQSYVKAAPEVSAPAESPAVVDEAPAVVEVEANAALLDADGGSPLVRVRRGSGDDTEIVAGRVSVREDGCLVFAAASTGEEG